MLEVILIIVSILIGIIISAYIAHYKINSKIIVSYFNRILFYIFGLILPISGVAYLYYYSTFNKSFVIFVALYSMVFLLNLNLLLFHLPSLKKRIKENQ